jgi:four helix bundle protein
VALLVHRSAAMRTGDAHGADVRERSFRFACRVVTFCAALHRQGGVAREMAPQLLESGTALYAMLEEARAAENARDFISKCSIGLKEVREAYGRLRLHEDSGIDPLHDARELRIEADELIAIMTTIVGKTTSRISNS